jgi:hypothetical protein
MTLRRWPQEDDGLPGGVICNKRRGIMKSQHPFLWLATVFLMVFLFHGTAGAHEQHRCPPQFPDAPVLPGHIEHADIVDGELSFQEIVAAGEELFVARFNICDGQGRPAATGTGEKRVADQPDFIRTSAPDANGCGGCHAQPRAGGGGDFVANVFVLAQALDPVTSSVSPEFSNERNTLGMNGAGPIEMLAREMTAELQSQAPFLADGWHTITAKGVEFDVQIAGSVVVSARGVNPDLVIRPFHQAGVVVSLREFTDNAMNHHHGMQAEERFDLNPAKGYDADHDEDGVTRELTVGDITTVAVFQAALGTPGRLMPPAGSHEYRAVMRGEELFGDVGCEACHVPEMVLENRSFVEPNPLNPAGTFRDTDQSFSFDMTEEGEGPRLEKAPGGRAIVRAYTDLKRHNLCDPPGYPDPIRYFCNEQFAQGRPDQDGRPGAEFFLTRKLWDVGNSSPYGHRGDLTTITEAILAHAGEARASRDAFVSLPHRKQAYIVKFLKTLQVLPPGSPLLVVEDRQ